MFPTQLRTGNSNVNADDNFLEHVHKLLMIFSEKSIVLGSHYAKCAGRENLSGMDTIYALQYLAHEFPHMDMNNVCPSQFTDSDEDTCSEDENELCSEDDDTFTRAPNSDSICAKMNEYHDTWDDWHPTDNIELLLKENIDKTLQTITC